jgi:hypothetical protein
MKPKTPLPPLPPLPVEPKRKGVRYQHLSIDATGKAKVVPPKQRDWSMRAKKDRAKQVMPTRAKKIKLKQEIWDAKTVCNFFRKEGILASATSWNIKYGDEIHEMTNVNQIDLFLEHGDTEYLVKYNYEKWIMSITPL